eukprot:Hpha_TRINITY_DN14718_c0_g2::TRINITY_DN14718_c0_g2_i1::g.102498::m.102498
MVHTERVRAQHDIESVREAAEAEAEGMLSREHAKSETRRELAILLGGELMELEWRRQREGEESLERDHITYSLIHAVATEGSRCAEAAERRVRAEREQLVLACAVTVERGKRATVERDEAECRLLIRRASIPPKVVDEEAMARRLIDADYARALLPSFRWHALWLAEVTAAVDLELSSKREAHKAAVRELDTLRERAGISEGVLSEETNKRGALLRANKVLRQALDSCHFADICRVELDNLQLKEATVRVLTEREAERDAQRLALGLCSYLTSESASQSGTALEGVRRVAQAADIEADAMLRGGSRSENAVRAVAANCRRTAAQLPRYQRDQKERWDFTYRILNAASRGLSSGLLDAALIEEALGAAFAEALRGGYPHFEAYMHVADSPHPGANWKRRLFVFNNGNLSHSAPGQTKSRTLLRVDSILAVRSDASGPSCPDETSRERPNGRYQTFLWSVETVAGDKFRFACPTQQERVEWVRALTEAHKVFRRNTGGDTRRLAAMKKSPSVRTAASRRQVGVSPSPVSIVETDNKEPTEGSWYIGEQSPAGVHEEGWGARAANEGWGARPPQPQPPPRQPWEAPPRQPWEWEEGEPIFAAPDAVSSRATEINGVFVDPQLI